MGIMLEQLCKRRVSPLSLGLDWQAQCLRMVLLQASNNSRSTHGSHCCLGQWAVPIPQFDPFGSPDESEAAWFQCLAQINNLVGQRHLWVTVGLPKVCFTWLHGPHVQIANAQQPRRWHHRLVISQIKQLAHQRWAAEKLNLDASSVLVEHLQLAPALTMLLVLNAHYARPVEHLLAHLQTVVNTTLEASLEPLVLSRVQCPKAVDLRGSMAWWLAQKCWGKS